MLAHRLNLERSDLPATASGAIVRRSQPHSLTVTACLAVATLTLGLLARYGFEDRSVPAFPTPGTAATELDGDLPSPIRREPYRLAMAAVPNAPGNPVAVPRGDREPVRTADPSMSGDQRFLSRLPIGERLFQRLAQSHALAEAVARRTAPGLAAIPVHITASAQDTGIARADLPPGPTLEDGTLTRAPTERHPTPTNERLYRDVVVVDVTILRLDGRILRLAGIEPPPMTRNCPLADGSPALCVDRGLANLELLLQGRPLICASAGDAAVKCRLGQIDLAEWLLRQGWARALTPEDPQLAAAEQDARQRKLGIWHG